MKSKTIIIFLLLILMTSSCYKGNSSVSKYVKQQIGKNIIINTNHYGMSGKILLDSLFDKSQFIIFTTIREGACPTCFFSTLLEMNSIIDSCYSNIVNCIVFTPDHYEEYLSLKDENGLANIYFICDYDEYYTNDNKLNKYTAEYRTFLVDKKGKILLVGNPFLNSNVRKLYVQELNRHLRNE